MPNPRLQRPALQQNAKHTQLGTPYLTSTDGVELFLQNFLHRFLFFKGDENKASSFVRLWIHWKLNGFNLQT